MALGIEDYALISDCHTGAMVGTDGSIDWLCLPRYDSASVFGALLGTQDHGRWLLAPTDPDAVSERHYRGESFVLVTTWTTSTGVVEVIDAMPRTEHSANLVRRVRGVSGEVDMHVDLRMRFGYASSVPWVRQLRDESNTLLAVAGPDALVIRGVKLAPADHSHEGTFTVREGDVVDHSLAWYPSHKPQPEPIDVNKGILATEKWWNDWLPRSRTAVPMPTRCFAPCSCCGRSRMPTRVAWRRPRPPHCPRSSAALAIGTTATCGSGMRRRP